MRIASTHGNKKTSRITRKAHGGKRANAVHVGKTYRSKRRGGSR